MIAKANKLGIGESMIIDNPCMSASMYSQWLNEGDRKFEVQWITTNWEASLGYTQVTRIA